MKMDYKKLSYLAKALENLINEHGFRSQPVRDFAVRHSGEPGFQNVAAAVVRKRIHKGR